MRWTCHPTRWALVMVFAIAATACAPGGSSQQSTVNGDGVTSTTIPLGMDLPITGAGLAFPSDVQAAASAYWRWQADQHNTIGGRTVTLTVSDDQFSSSVATQNCTQMSANSFLLLGYAGTSVIGACAAIASRAAIPFV